MDFIYKHRYEALVVAGLTSFAIVKNIWYDREWKDLKSGKKCLIRNLLIMPVVATISAVAVNILPRVDSAIWQKWFSASFDSKSSGAILHTNITFLLSLTIFAPTVAIGASWSLLVRQRLDKWYQNNRSC